MTYIYNVLIKIGLGSKWEIYIQRTWLCQIRLMAVVFLLA